jgi:hypothetical protein
MTTQQAMANLKVLPFGGAGCVADPNMQSQVYDLIKGLADDDVLNDISIQEQYLDRYQIWIRSSRLNELQGLDQFPVAAYANGTSEGFDKFYLKHNRRRFRCFRGEYMYHPASWRNYFPGWKHLDDGPVEANDAVVISMPFSDTGDIHKETLQVLDQCATLSVPVLIDSAFFGICRGIEFNYDHPAITDIAFSLSKSFPVANLRIGMRLTRTDDDDSLLVHNKTNYNNRLGAGVGLELLRRFTPDYNTQTWGSNQLWFCKQLGIRPSKSVIFGLAGPEYSKYNRGGTTNRLCFAKYLRSGNLPND